VGLGELCFRRYGLAGEDVTRLLAGDGRAEFGLEADNEADLLAEATHIVPRDEEAVGVSDFRLAVVAFQLLGRKDIFASRSRVGRFSSVFIEGVDNEISVDLDWLLFPVPIEHEAPAEPAGWCLALRVADRIDPDCQDT